MVCFDFFDTLVHRTVEPEQTKRLACKRLSLLLGNGLSGRNLYQLRRSLETKLCSQNAAKGKDYEFNFSEFAIAFHELLNNRFSSTPRFLTTDLFSDLLLKIEIAVEKQVQRIFNDTQDLLWAISERGIKTAIVSDFYIPASYFQHFLNHHGLSNHIDALFISADFGLTKSSGRLYDKVLESLGCSPEKVGMVGDNEHSDIQMAAAKGIRAFHIDRQQQKLFYQKLARHQQNREQEAKKLETDIRIVTRRKGGKLFPEIATSLWRFTSLLFKQLIHKGVKNVFFFSKEGEFLKILFEQFQEIQFGDHIIATHYLMVSRKSTYICSLKPLKDETFSGIFQQYRSISPRDFLLSLNFSTLEAETLCRENSVDFEKPLNDFPTSDTLATIFRSKTFADLYENKRQYQKRNLLKYLASFGVDFQKEDLHVVDVGWKGSIQDNIFFALEKAVIVNGYYIGLLQTTNLGESNRKTGILFSENPAKTPFFDVYNCNRSLFEMILDATHGSADGYYDDGEGELQEIESIVCEIKRFPGQTDICVHTLDLQDERKLFTERIQPIQERILSVCKEINQLTTTTDAPEPGAEWYARQHARMMYRETRREVRFFESLYHLENFGIFIFTEFKSGTRLSLRDRLKNLKQVIENPSTILKTGIWPPIVLKRLGLGMLRRRLGVNSYRNMFLKGDIRSNRSNGKRIVNAWNRIKSKKNIKIAFLLGDPEISGGTYVIFEHAVRLKHKGYQVFILTSEHIHPNRYAWHPEASELEWFTFEGAGHLAFDFAIATWWMSTLFLRRINAITYLYFVQSIESRFFSSDGLASYEEKAFRRLSENTYLLPLPIITEARWIQRYLRENYTHNGFLVLNGIRKDLYTESGDCKAPRTPGRLRVLVEGLLGVSYKNVERAIELIRRSDADEVWLLTISEVDAYPGVDRVFSQVPIWETPSIYRSCDVLVKLSTIEGMFGPPLEMFHCGGTAIVYDVTGHDEYIRHDVNSLVVKLDDENRVVEYLNLLKHQPEELERLKRGARETANDWPDWGVSSHRFESVLKQLKGRSWPNRAYLNKMTDHLWHHAENDTKIFKLLPFYQEGEQTSQCYQVFWHFGEGFSERESQKIDFKSGKWVSLKSKVPVRPSKRMYLRIDPCMQIGVVIMKHIRIYDTTNKQNILQYDIDTGWNGIKISGTASLINDSNAFTIESNDQDPQIIISPFELDRGINEIVVEVSLRFLPFRQAVREMIPTMENLN